MTPKEKRRSIEALEKTMKTAKLPQTDSIEELARFWDMHDLTDFEEQLEEVTEPVFERKSETVMTIDLSPQEAETVKRIAESKGIDHEVLIREWVLEKLHE
ncbi:MAG: CopG family antitoxin [Gammaproteobacteria bacterium]